MGVSEARRVGVEAGAPGPTPQQLAAIAAAVELVWPRPVVVAPDAPRQSDAWRFSGRWWTRPVVQRRERPWS
jgi:hypothetical protein